MLSRNDARYLLDGVTTMASESYAATDFYRPDSGAGPEEFWALIDKLVKVAELDEGELHYFMAFFRRNPAGQADAGPPRS